MSELRLVSVATHPRSSGSVRRAKSWGGLAGFGLVAAGGWLSGAELGDLLLKSLAGGIVGALLMIWTGALAEGLLPSTLLTGGAYFHHADSFAMMRGGHLDICVLGAFQVSRTGDLANWHTGAPDAIPAVGGAMDLAIGAKQVFVMMEHQTKTGDSKIVEACSYPLTGIGCVSRIYTDLAVLDVTPEGLRVLEMAPGLTLTDLQAVTAAPLLPPTASKETKHA